MATPPLFNSSNKVRAFSDKTCGLSKSQICLKKILDIISSGSSIHPCEILKRTSQTSQNPISNELKCEKEGSNEKVRDLFIEKRGIGIDLNLRLGPPPLDTEESENLTVNKGFSACSGVGDGDGDGDGDGKVSRINIDYNSSVVSAEYFTKSSEGECDPKEVAKSTEGFPVNRKEEEEEEQQVIEEERREFSEITNLPETETKDETEDREQCEIKEEEERENEVEVDEEEEEREKQKEEVEKCLRSRENKNDGYLDLLVEAARLISGNFEDDEPEDEEKKENRSRNGRLSIESNEETQMITEAETRPNNNSIRPKRDQCWTFDFYEDFEDISPIVRSKRGRNQVLPLRYRDSVLDPWKRLTKQRTSRVSSKNKN